MCKLSWYRLMLSVRSQNTECKVEKIFLCAVWMCVDSLLNLEGHVEVG